ALPPLFLVMATQNPIEQEGTFPLPEAQLDRFLMHVRIGYPDAEMETEILRLARLQARERLHEPAVPAERMSQAMVFAAREQVLELHLAPSLERYLVELVLASRDAARYDAALARRIAWGASPRGSIALERCARARAWLAGRDYVTPDDIRAVAPDVLRHRVLPSYEALAEGWDGDRLVGALLDLVPPPRAAPRSGIRGRLAMASSRGWRSWSRCGTKRRGWTRRASGAPGCAVPRLPACAAAAWNMPSRASTCPATTCGAWTGG